MRNKLFTNVRHVAYTTVHIPQSTMGVGHYFYFIDEKLKLISRSQLIQSHWGLKILGCIGTQCPASLHWPGSRHSCPAVYRDLCQPHTLGNPPSKPSSWMDCSWPEWSCAPRPCPLRRSKICSLSVMFQAMMLQRTIPFPFRLPHVHSLPSRCIFTQEKPKLLFCLHNFLGSRLEGQLS